MKPNELDALIEDCLEGRLSEPDAARFSALLEQSAEARARYWETASIHSLLEHTMQGASLRVVTGKALATIPRTHRWFQWRPLSAAAALVVVVALGAWLNFESSHDHERSFATMMVTTNARWSDPNVELALSSGERVPTALRLESGHAEFQLLDGATVVLNGPASVRFAERKTVFVDEGRVFCKCPTPESRIAVVTPQTKVVDLGTEFSVEARADESTRVAVLSGKVQVMSHNAGVLTAGEVMDVKGSQVLRLKPLTTYETAALTRESVPSHAASDAAGQNRLLDPGFEKTLPSAFWRGTDDCLEQAASLGRSGASMRVRAMEKHYPLVKQRVETDDISGKVVQASVWAKSPPDDPISPKQCAVLKMAFLNAEGREFACSTRHFLHQGEPANVYVPVQLAAQAPQGTRFVEVQLMLAAGTQKAGSVCFDDGSLVISNAPEKK